MFWGGTRALGHIPGLGPGQPYKLASPGSYSAQGDSQAGQRLDLMYQEGFPQRLQGQRGQEEELSSLFRWPDLPLWGGGTFNKPLAWRGLREGCSTRETQEAACARNVAGRPTGAGIGFAWSTTDALLSLYRLHTEHVQYAKV